MLIYAGNEITPLYVSKGTQPREIINLCVKLNHLGLKVNPGFKEVYVIPFKVKIGNTYVMLPQAIIPLNGIQEMAHAKGFFLRAYEVYNLDGDIVSEREMTRKHQLLLDTSNENWVNSHFVGFDVVLEDIKNEIPQQTKFVEQKYLDEVTKTVKDKRFKIQTWRHKAVRRAFGDFYIPRERSLDVFSSVEAINDNILESSQKLPVNENTLEQLGLKTVQKNNELIIEGNTYGKTEHLKALGFKFSNNTWSKIQENIVEADVLPSQEYSAKDLKQFLQENRLDVKRMGAFVNNVLGITSDDTAGINKVMSDKASLGLMIEEFLQNDAA